MPAPGDQHQATTVTANPFQEPEHNVGTYTAEQVATLQARLNKNLGPEYISSRDGPGGKKLHYVAAAQCIQLANEVFGFNGWSSSIREVQVDYVEEIPNTGKFNMAVSVIMRVTLRDGTYHEDIGYGQIENCKSKAMGFEKTKKEATTDALKRALRNFGNVLGNCIYDKDYVSKVTKVKVKPRRFDVEELHRAPEYMLVKAEATRPAEEPQRVISEPELPRQESTTNDYQKVAVEDEFDAADFDDLDFSVADDSHPDGVVIEEPVISNHFGGPHSAIANGRPSAGQRVPQQRSTTVQQAQTRAAGRPEPRPPGMHAPGMPSSGPQHKLPSNNAAPVRPGYSTTNQSQARIPQQMSALEVPALAGQAPNAPLPAHIADMNVPATFFSARAASEVHAAVLQGEAPPTNATTFNPHAESPSIRKTAGVDHSKSMKIGRDLRPAEKPSTSGSPANNFSNPGLEGIRQIGLPPNRASPLANRSTYKPPLKRSLDADGPGVNRPPLNDVTNAANKIDPPQTVPDHKRPRLEEAKVTQVVSQ